MNTFERIRTLMEEKFGLEKSTLTPEATLETLGLDSLSVIELMFSIEDVFEIKLPDEPVPLKTLQDVVDTVDKLISEQHGKA
ncbi:MAG: acyl carrier protein [Proteobacteria bacterium]|nr:acyl carrier protein [Pseudomonadota bacterium]MDE3208576.1 acyl carrier protein [Pseudomonadota bacterium]